MKSDIERIGPGIRIQKKYFGFRFEKGHQTQLYVF